MGGILFRLQAGPRTLANAMPKPPACIIGPRYAAANPAGRFLVVRSGGKWGGLFWATSLEKIFRGVIAIISFRPGGWMQQSAVPRCAMLSVGSTGGIGQ